MRPLIQLYLAVTYYLSWLLFGIGGFLLNLVCAVLLIFPRRERFGTPVRAAIRWLFAFWLKWLHASRVVQIHWTGPQGSDLADGTVYVANHPTLVDATVLLSRLPGAICIFKAALLRNPVIAPAALVAGYVSGDAGLDLIRIASDKIAAGRSLLVFPEGTRTAPGSKLNPLKPGFALIARRARAPIRLITIHASRHLVCRNRAWWRLPDLPGRIDVHVGEIISPNTDMTTLDLTREVADYFSRHASVLPPV
jgi:1-acyl-sn-glycerol-3-phosphate acyltransferase